MTEFLLPVSLDTSDVSCDFEGSVFQRGGPIYRGRVVGVIFKAGRIRTLAGVGGLTALIAAADWYVGITASLGVFYIVPMVIGATVLQWPGLVLLAIICSCLRSWFDVPAPLYEQLLRFVFATLAYIASGLLVGALIPESGDDDQSSGEYPA